MIHSVKIVIMKLTFVKVVIIQIIGLLYDYIICNKYSKKVRVLREPVAFKDPILQPKNLSYIHFGLKLY